MKTPLRSTLVATALFASILQAEVAPSPFGDNLGTAKEKARESHKDVFVNFTGSDWCGWCLALEKEVFRTPEFGTEAERGFELVQLDFPHDEKKQPAETTARNKAWKAELKSSSFPDILLLDETGKVFARTGYREGGARAFLNHLESLRQRRIQRDTALALVSKSEGLEKAKHLDAALSALHDDDVLLTYYRAEIDGILALDPRDEGGLQTRYQAIFKRKQCEREIDRLCTGNDGTAMLSRFKEYAARTDIPAESRPYALYMGGALACERLLKDPRQALELLNEAEGLAPGSPLATDRLHEARLRLERKIAKEQTKRSEKPVSGS